MGQRYFDYNGKRYGYGTIIKVRWKFGEEKNMTFVHCDSAKGHYTFKYDDSMCKSGYKLFVYTLKTLEENLIEITNQIDTTYVKNHPLTTTPNKATFKEELQIDKMIVAWAWYIVLMAITFVFNGRIFYWIILSLCFWVYRFITLKEEGYK